MTNKNSIFTEEKIKKAEDQIVEYSRKIDYYLTDYSVNLLACKMANGDFEVPNYKREFTWEEERKSRFIESLIMGLPIPVLFFWENPETNNLEIVDGTQRLRTIQDFILGDFVLSELDELSLLTGFRFKDLPESRQRKIKNRSIRGIIINENSDEQSRFDLFERINTGSKIAKMAEIRRGALGGPFLDLVIKLSEISLFKGLAPVSERQSKEREREELVTRFFAYSDGLDGYKDKVSSFLFSYAKKMNLHFSEYPTDIGEYEQRFIQTMNFIKRIFPGGFRRSKTGNFTPRSRFEAISIGSYLALKECPELNQRSIQVGHWLNSDEFITVVGSDGANMVSKLKNRINYVKDRLLEVKDE